MSRAEFETVAKLFPWLEIETRRVIRSGGVDGKLEPILWYEKKRELGYAKNTSRLEAHVFSRDLLYALKTVVLEYASSNMGKEFGEAQFRVLLARGDFAKYKLFRLSRNSHGGFFVAFCTDEAALERIFAQDKKRRMAPNSYFMLSPDETDYLTLAASDAIAQASFTP